MLKFAEKHWWATVGFMAMVVVVIYLAVNSLSSNLEFVEFINSPVSEMKVWHLLVALFLIGLITRD